MEGASRRVWSRGPKIKLQNPALIRNGASALPTVTFVMSGQRSKRQTRMTLKSSQCRFEAVAFSGHFCLRQKILATVQRHRLLKGEHSTPIVSRIETHCVVHASRVRKKSEMRSDTMLSTIARKFKCVCACVCDSDFPVT